MFKIVLFNTFLIVCLMALSVFLLLALKETNRNLNNLRENIINGTTKTTTAETTTTSATTTATTKENIGYEVS